MLTVDRSAQAEPVTVWLAQGQDLLKCDEAGLRGSGEGEESPRELVALGNSSCEKLLWQRATRLQSRQRELCPWIWNNSIVEFHECSLLIPSWSHVWELNTGGQRRKASAHVVSVLVTLRLMVTGLPHKTKKKGSCDIREDCYEPLSKSHSYPLSLREYIAHEPWGPDSSVTFPRVLFFIYPTLHYISFQKSDEIIFTFHKGDF